MQRKKGRPHDDAQQQAMERSDEVAASASPQGDGVPGPEGAGAGGTAGVDAGGAAARGSGESGDGGGGGDTRPPAADSYLATDGSAAESTGATVAAREREEESQRALADQREKYLRLAAEYDNYRKRTTRERMEAGARAQAELVRQLLDALDDLGRFAHIDPATVDCATVVQGVELVERKLLKALGSAGLEVVNPQDEQFNPERHEAVATEPTPASEDDHQVARVYQLGYVFNGQLLRPARVVVKQWTG